MNELMEVQNEIVETQTEIVEVKKEPKKFGKGLALILCLVIALTSFFVVGGYATSAKSYSKTIHSIDEKKAAVMGITTLAAGASLALAAVPSDATTPIANEIMDLSSYLLIVVCALVFQKSLLTVFGGLAFKVLIPVACLMFAISAFKNPNFWKVMSIKVAVFAVALAMVVPISLKVSDLIYEVNKETVEELDDEVAAMKMEETTSKSNEKEDEQNLWGKLKDAATKVTDGVTKVAVTVKDTAMNLMNKIIDAIALFIIVYCAIPILIFVLMGWLLKLLFGVKVPVPTKNPFQTVGRKVVGKVTRGSDKEE